MRIKIIGNGKDGVFPLNYRTMVMSMIKKALEISDEEYFKELYFYNGKKNKKIKPFCFGVYFKDYHIKEDIVHINGEVSITISTANYNLGISLYNGLLKINEYTFNKEYTFIKRKVILEKEKDINSKKVNLKTMSPIYIKDKNNKALNIEDDGYVKELNYICDVLLSTYRGYGLKEKLVFTPINMKKVVIKEKIKDFIKHSNKEYMYISAYSGAFSLEGDIEDIRVLMLTGIGFRRGEGLGLLDLM